MKNCDKYIDLISAYIDGEISQTGKKDLEIHLGECAECRRILEEYNAISSELYEEDSPEYLPKGIMYKIELENNGVKTKHFAFGKWTVVAAAAALVILCAGYLGMGQSGDGTSLYSTEATVNEDAAEESVEADNEIIDDADEGEYTDAEYESADLEEDSVTAYEGTYYGLYDIDAAVESGKWSIVAEIVGDIPDELSNYEFTEEGSGVITAEVPADIIEEIDDRLNTAIYVNTDSDLALVIIYTYEGQAAAE